jgi:hypothetical protein
MPAVSIMEYFVVEIGSALLYVSSSCGSQRTEKHRQAATLAHQIIVPNWLCTKMNMLTLHTFSHASQ